MNSETKIRDEESLLMELCRLEFSDVHLEKIRSLIAVVDNWDYFRSLANAHGVAALIWHNLEKHNLQNGIPIEVISFLKGTLMLSLSRNVFNTEIMGDVLQLLNRENIRVVLLKGLALEISVYGNAGLRQMSDVDVLISREQCLQARKILITNGFISLPVKSVFHEFIITDIGKHLPSLIRNGISIEIHHELFGNRKNALTRMLYDSSYEVEIKGEKTYLPQPQVFFIYLVRHILLHEMRNESQLRLYTDLVVLIGKYYNDIINYDLLTYVSQAGIPEALASRLEILRRFWGISFPEWIDDFIEKFKNPDLVNKFIFFLKSPKDNLSDGKPKFYRYIINEIPGIHRKFLFLLGDIFPSFSFMKTRYRCTSNWRVLLYYPHRFGKIMWLFRK